MRIESRGFFDRGRIVAMAAAIALVGAVALAQPARSASASSVSSVSLVPADRTAGATTPYTVSFARTQDLGSGGTITIDWWGDGVSSGVIQQLLPATVSFALGATNCAGTVSVSGGNTVITLSNSGGVCRIPAFMTLQFSVTNVRNPKYSGGSAGGIRTSADNGATVLDSSWWTWPALGINTTAAGSPGIGPAVTTIAAAAGTLDVNVYPVGLEPVTLSTIGGGVFARNGQTVILCQDGDTNCDLDGSINGVVTLAVSGNGLVGPISIVATSGGHTVSAPVNLVGPPAAVVVSASPQAINAGGTAPSVVTATVTDATGNPVPDGTTTTFTASLGSPAPASATTTVGVATTRLTSTVAGTAFVTAAAGSATGTVTVVVRPTVTATATGVYCFVYAGTQVPVASFASAFAPTVVSVNVLQLPAGNYLSWFRAAPSLATVSGLDSGQTVCVSAPVGSNVFA